MRVHARCTVCDVDYATDGQPVFVPAELENITVVEDERATLLCHVYGDVSTRLQVRCHDVSSLVAHCFSDGQPWS